MSQTLTTWKRGRELLGYTQDELDKLFRVCSIIKQAEEKYDNLIEYTRTPFCAAFPELRAKTFREAAATLAAHDRLIKYFNNAINEILL